MTAQGTRLLQSCPLGRPENLLGKALFSPHFSYIFLFFFLDDRILVPTSAPDFHGIIREPWELETSSPGALGDLL